MRVHQRWGNALNILLRIIQFLIRVSTGLAALILVLLPFFVALDYGGILWWTHHAVGLAVVIALALSLPSIFDRTYQPSMRQLVILGIMLLWLAFTGFQSIELPMNWLEVLSPGSFAAYSEWLPPILPSEPVPQHASISVFPEQTRHAFAVFSIALATAWAAMRVFDTRPRMIILLSGVSIVGAAISLLGILRLTLPQLLFFDYFAVDGPNCFATFVNRNNGALFINMGFAASLGLLAWRLSVLAGQEVDDEGFEFNDLFSLASDRDSLIGVSGAVLCLLGLLICGSRGGLAAALVAFLFSLGWLRKKRGVATVAVAIGGALGVALLLAAPLNLGFKSIDRFQFFSEKSTTITSDSRYATTAEAVIWPLRVR